MYLYLKKDFHSVLEMMYSSVKCNSQCFVANQSIEACVAIIQFVVKGVSESFDCHVGVF